MDDQSELSAFLVTRRAGVTPAQAGVQANGGARRVPGLRREEVARLAGVSVDRYTRLERGQTAGASIEVLDAVARALQLDDADRQHLLHLVQATRPSRREEAPVRRSHVRPPIQAVLNSITTPAIVQNERLDLLATNSLGRAVYSLVLDDPIRPANFTRFNFLDPRARDFHHDWHLATSDNVALLHAAAVRDPENEELINLIGQLSSQSETFRTLWGSRNVLQSRSGAKQYHHPILGDLAFGFEALAIATDPGQQITVLTIETGSPTQRVLDLLASWATSPEVGGINI